MPASLRLFPGPAGDETPERRAAVPLRDLLDVANAHAGRAWLEDFAGERVFVSSDLADVLFAAKAMHVGPPGSPARRAA